MPRLLTSKVGRACFTNLCQDNIWLSCRKRGAGEGQMDELIGRSRRQCRRRQSDRDNRGRHHSAIPRQGRSCGQGPAVDRQAARRRSGNSKRRRRFRFRRNVRRRCHGRRHPHDGGRIEHGSGPGRHPRDHQLRKRKARGGRSRRDSRRDPRTRPVRLTLGGVRRTVGGSRGEIDVVSAHPHRGARCGRDQVAQSHRHPHHRAAARGGQEPEGPRAPRRQDRRSARSGC